MLSVDLLRGFALICMVLIHFMIYFGTREAADTWLYFIFNHVLGDMGASCFLMIMGLSQVLSGERRAALDSLLLFKRAFIRGGFIFVSGLVMLALAFGPSQIWRWDILTLMGLATLTLYLCRFLPSWVILLAVAAVAVSTPLLRGQLDVVSLWGNKFQQVPVISRYFPGLMLDPVQEYEVVWQVRNIVQGFLFAGEFPVFPWMLFPLTGFVLGRRLVRGQLQKDLLWLIPAGAAIAMFGVLLGYAGSLRPASSIISDYISPLSFYPDSFSLICFQFGISITLLLSVYYRYDVRGKDPAAAGFFVRLFNQTSRSALTYYVLHYLLIGWTLAIACLFSGKSRTAGLMGSLPALLCGLGAVGMLGLALASWEKRGGRFRLEWLLAAVTRRLTSTV